MVGIFDPPEIIGVVCTSVPGWIEKVKVNVYPIQAKKYPYFPTFLEYGARYDIYKKDIDKTV
jgi:hypothetical protein